ncbi:hypothetical protein [Gottfriedia luciferensis]|uniref:hypothetical protein n=1 Tax=Gottfriedia luciferensis TaxID=178774 RepID=UPI000B4378BC|nr:hypothetical protein [Gottfriedia luciferensis]
MDFRIDIAINMDFDFTKIDEDFDAFERIMGKLNLNIDNQDFMDKFLPVKDSENYYKDLKVENYDIPVLSYVTELSFFITDKEKEAYEVFRLNEDFMAIEYIFKNDGCNTHIFLRSKPENLIYDGNKVFKSLEIPKTSYFNIPNHIFFEEIYRSLKQFKKDIITVPKELAEDELFKRVLFFLEGFE